MDYDTFSAAFADFRRGLYACFRRAGDALMNANDALLCDTTARSFIELSLSACFVRRWPSLYEAMEDGVIDRTALQKLFAAHVSPLPPSQRRVIGVDASSIARPLSPTARDRTYVHASNLPEGSKPVTPGWQYSTLSVLPPTPSSWTYVLDNQRIPSQSTQAQVAAQQLASVLPLLPADALPTGTVPLPPLLLADGYYGSATFLQQTKHLDCDKLLRLAKNRVLYRPAPPKTGRPGAPKKDGPRFCCGQAQTHGTPDQQWSGLDESGQPMEVACWQNLHFKEDRALPVCVLRVTRPHAAQTKRDPRVSWFVFCGRCLPPLSQVAALYRRRYSLEHGYRVDKQDLLWATPRLRTPEAFDHWTDLVSSVRNQLCLARPLVQAARQPWESGRRAATPQQVRRACGRIIAQLGTPACAPQVRGKSPGRRLGAVMKKAPRYAVVYKATPKAKQLV
jgi:hypothetical protein